MGQEAQALAPHGIDDLEACRWSTTKIAIVLVSSERVGGRGVQDTPRVTVFVERSLIVGREIAKTLRSER